jgi:hypothetical protein
MQKHLVRGMTQQAPFRKIFSWWVSSSQTVAKNKESRGDVELIPLGQ